MLFDVKEKIYVGDNNYMSYEEIGKKVGVNPVAILFRHKCHGWTPEELLENKKVPIEEQLKLFK